jgi:hypothetical protein
VSCQSSTKEGHIGCYAFDPRRVAILLLGGEKTGDDRWYDKMVPKADALYGRHLRETKDL